MNILNYKINTNLEWLDSGTIFVGKHGSHAYGLSTAESDLDIRGVAIPPREYFLGFNKKFEQFTTNSVDVDLTIFDIRKFFSLAVDCNPNVIELLFLDQEDWIRWNDLWKEIVKHRLLFLSKKAKHTFSGYAVSQLKRIKRHRSWLLSPPKKKPERSDFGATAIDQNTLGALDEMVNEGENLSGWVMEKFTAEKAYRNALKEWNQFLEWQKNRNPKRAELEAKYGFDAKHAMHLVRLMTMCEEILSQGKLIVKRPDRDFLLSIKNGEWSYDELIAWADYQDIKLDKLKDQSSLPDKVDRDFLDKLCVELIEEQQKREGRIDIVP